MGDFRKDRVNSLLKELAGKFMRTVLGKDILVSVIRVETSSDLKNATIFVSIFPEEKVEGAFKKLHGSLGNFQREMARELKMKNLPHFDIEIEEMHVA